jgi:regulator of RNase E activity RraA
MNNIPELSQEIIDGFRELDTTSVSDALDRLGISGGLLGIKAILPGSRLCGQAFTVHYVPCGTVKGTVGDFLDDVRPGQVVVIDNAGRTDCTVWGDLMSITAVRNRVAGTVIDGVCRDVPGIMKSGYAIFSRGAYMVTGKDRVYVDQINVPISIAGVQVKPGDLMLGDDSGVVVVPFERAEEVLRIAREIDAKEKAIEAELAKGVTLKEARAHAGYHTLQTREE